MPAQSDAHLWCGRGGVDDAVQARPGAQAALGFLLRQGCQGSAAWTKWHRRAGDTEAGAVTVQRGMVFAAPMSRAIAETNRTCRPPIEPAPPSATMRTLSY